MMIEEFEKRTGFYPDAVTYQVIEECAFPRSMRGFQQNQQATRGILRP